MVKGFGFLGRWWNSFVASRNISKTEGVKRLRYMFVML